MIECRGCVNSQHIENILVMIVALPETNSHSTTMGYAKDGKCPFFYFSTILSPINASRDRVKANIMYVCMYMRSLDFYPTKAILTGGFFLLLLKIAMLVSTRIKIIPESGKKKGDFSIFLQINTPRPPVQRFHAVDGGQDVHEIIKYAVAPCTIGA